ncbi:glutamate receptor ionotropic, NMDA 1-like [Anopheles marshallii]|uniref:glutamate receptor ionotropic, NMDA 1-like n=1 Tax=Anopheles marshallii TaxID=1521116 RepID=UPI00237A7917|nr:glutamate receptor ionotropic, NMDA 1-like [Anopheles marshallii]
MRYWMLLLLCFFVPAVLTMATERLLVDLVNWYHLRVVYVFHCYNEQHSAEYIHLLHSARKNRSESMSFVNVASFSEQKFVTSLEPVHVRVGFMADMSCQDTDRVLAMLAERGYLNGVRFRWFLYGLRAIEEIGAFFRKLHITVPSGVLLLQPVGVDSSAVLDVRSAQWMGMSGDVSFPQIGSWSVANGLTMWDNRSAYERQLNLFGMQLSGISKTRIMHGNRTLNDESLSTRAYGQRLWNLLSMVHNTSITERLSTYYDDHLADFIIEPVAIKQEDLHKLDYTAAVQNIQIILLFLHPDVDRTRNSFLRPFSTVVWVAIGAFFVGFTSLMYKTLTFEQQEQERAKAQRDRENGIMVIVLGILCQQGFIESCRTYASRLTLLSMLIFSMLIYQFYITHIVSFLLVVPPKNIQTLEQLVENEFDVAMENAPEIVEFVNATEDEHLLTLVQMKLAKTGTVYYDLKEGISSMLDGGRNAFVCEANRAYQLIRHHVTDEQRCALQEIPLMSKKSTHLALRKDHPLREQFRVTVQKIFATSMVQYERKRCYADKPRCDENEVKMPEVNLDQVSSVLVLLLGTIVGSIGVLLLEITVSKVLQGRH